MRRWLHSAPATFVLVAMLVFVPNASAQRIHVPYDHTAAVTETFVYWVKTRPAGCKDCRELRRTRLSDGRTERVSLVRHGRISYLTAGLGTVAYTVEYPGPTTRTRIYALRDDGVGRMLAEASIRRNSYGRCGSMVTTGAVSQAGEVAWTRTTAFTGFNCVYSFLRANSRVFAQTVESPPRQVGRTVKLDWKEADMYGGVQWVRKILAFNGSRYMYGAGQYRRMHIFDAVTGRDVEIPHSDIDYDSRSFAMGPDGAFAADYWAGLDHVKKARLIPDPMKSGGIVELASTDGYEEGVRFCGAGLFQLRTDTGRFIVIRRDSAGLEVGRTTLSVPNWASSFEFDCNSTTGLLRYIKWRDAGEVRGETALAFSLPQINHEAP